MDNFTLFIVIFTVGFPSIVILLCLLFDSFKKHKEKKEIIRAVKKREKTVYFHKE